MKIALLSAGNSIHTVRWVNGLIEKGVEVHLITSHPLIEGIDSRVSVYPLVFSSRYKWLSGSLAYFFNVIPLLLLLRRIKPDALHAHYASGYGLLGALGFFKPYIVSVWGSDIYLFPRMSSFKKAVIKFVLSRADHICSTSNDMLQETGKYTCLESKDHSVIPFGIVSEVYAIDRAINFSNRITIGTIKGLKAVYGIDYLIEAFNTLCSKVECESPYIFDKLTLLIVGGGEQEAYLKQFASEKTYHYKIEFMPAVPHSKVPYVLSLLDVFVAYSRSESFGVAVLEASASGLPVVTSNVGGLPEVVENGATGYVLKANDLGVLTEKLFEMVNDEMTARALGSEGVKFVRDNYDWELCLNMMLNVYEKILRENEISRDE